MHDYSIEFTPPSGGIKVSGGAGGTGYNQNKNIHIIKKSMKFHTSANGSRSLISQLSDDHLKNTISLIFTRLRTAKTIVKNATTTENIDLIGSGISISDMKEEAERKIEQILETLPFYIYEATIRGFKYTEELQEIHDRKEQLDFIGTALLLGDSKDIGDIF